MDEFLKKVDDLRTMLSADNQNIVVVAHSNPDGDAIGSALAWSSVLESHGHSVTCIVPNKYPYFLDWMSGISKILVFKEDKSGVVAEAVAAADIIFCMDFNQIGRLEALSDTIAANTSAKKVLIDHHLDPPKIYDIEFSYPPCSSTSFLVYKIIEAMDGVETITQPMAESIYVGMMTDTGNFSFSNLSAELYRSIATLIETGINIPYINSSVYNGFSEGRIRLLGYAIYSKMHIINEYGVAYIGLKESDLRRFKFQVGDSEGFVNYPLSIKGVNMSAMFLETRNFIRVSLRSRGDLDVNIFARRYFEGGGHKNAAGGKSFLSMEETVVKFEAAVTEYFT